MESKIKIEYSIIYSQFIIGSDIQLQWNIVYLMWYFKKIGSMNEICRWGTHKLLVQFVNIEDSIGS